ncbi:MAG: Ig-like domain-containing protein [Halofilum sp. (in: g-proteobacteria)]|nr:Ig-like domain-containing protein [Halofilum sp. (in: g-proteobacteria)]
METVVEGDSPNDPIDDTIEYTPNPSFTGSDSFRYRIEDADGDQDTATVTVTVDSAGGANDTPAANDDSLAIDENTAALGIEVLANDDFGNDGASNGSIVISTDALNGSTTVDVNGTLNDPTDDTIDYIPDTDFSGTDTFEYLIEDADGDRTRRP